MTPPLSKTKARIMARACSIAALLNGLAPAGQAEEVAPPGQIPAVPAPASTALSLGAFDVFPVARGSVVYDDNIYLNNNNRQSDAIWTLTPGVQAFAGDYRERTESYLSFFYAPSFIIFW